LFDLGRRFGDTVRVIDGELTANATRRQLFVRR
jgi:hypothetical protein